MNKLLMPRHLRRPRSLLLLCCGLAFVLLLTAPGYLARQEISAAQEAPAFRILVFWKTAGFEHTSIETAKKAIAALGAANNFAVDDTNNAQAFTDSNLAQYQAVVFLMTTGDVLDDVQQAAFERYIRAGGGFAGIHSASDTEFDWPWYGGLVGAYFKAHPPRTRTAAMVLENRTHPSTAHMPEVWSYREEWYTFRSNPRSKVNVLARLDESSYLTTTADISTYGMGDHPIAWFHEYDGGRAWYTGAGHREDTYGEPLFRQHILGGIRYAAGVVPATATATTTATSSLSATSSAAATQGPLGTATSPTVTSTSTQALLPATATTTSMPTGTTPAVPAPLPILRLPLIVR